jgi:membrane protease YdiL (CAAX protease family)
MSVIATSQTVTAGSESSEQHSLGMSLALHILPGIFILTLFLATAPLLMRAGFPPMLAIAIGAAFGLAYQVWHLYNMGKKLNSKWSLKGIILYRQSMPVWQYFVLIPLFVILAFLIDGLTKPVGMALLSYLPWLPQWFEMRDASQLLGYSRPALVLTFGVSLLVNGIAAPIVEELYFRGYLMSRISRFGRWTPVVETALFTLYHFWQPYYWVSQFLFTLPYISAVAWKRNVRLGIVIHIALNLLGGLLTAALILGQV